MDNFLTPPTDNLYKFIALSALVAAIFVPLYCYQQLFKLEREGAEHNMEVAAWRAEYEWAEKTTPPTSQPAIIEGFRGTREEYIASEKLKAHKAAIELQEKQIKQWFDIGS